jgi:enoyl-CoA hydratase/carnithine racemase
VESEIIDDDIAIIRITKPEVLNALDREVAAELSTAIDIANADDKIKVIIITGDRERSFWILVRYIII